MIPLIPSPGRPNITSTPQSIKVSTSTSAAVITSPPSAWVVLKMQFKSMLFTEPWGLLTKHSARVPIIRTTPIVTLTYSDRWIVCTQLRL